jgi:putative nucleotidyltransferase with HDIG domain
VSKRFERVEPIGLPHGTVLVLFDGIQIECTTFRREGAYADARHPDRVEFTRDPAEDLARRDLTVNAMAFDPVSGVLLDPHGGALDLERRRLRAVGDPRARFAEDALRPLRVARLAAVLEMEPETETRAALGGALERARRVAVERVRVELEKLMSAPRPSEGIELLRAAGLLQLWMPELARTWAVPQNRYHAYDVYLHSLYTADAAPADKPRVRWAALLHDIGKPDTRVERGGDGTFYNHQFVGAELADRLLERLRFPHEERTAIVHLIREHMFDYRGGWSDAGLRRWLRRVGEEYVADLFDLRIADMLGNGLKQGFPTYLAEMSARVDRILAESRALKVTDLAIGGRDVMDTLGIPPGPAVGETLEALLEEVLDDPSRNTRERLLERLAERRDSIARPRTSA